MTPYPSLYFPSSRLHFIHAFRRSTKLTTPADRSVAPAMISICKCKRSLAETPSCKSHAPAKRMASAKMMLMSSTGASFPGGLSNQIAIFFKAADKFIIRIEHSENWRAIMFLHLRAAEASRVGLGFDGSFDYYDFARTITILAAENLTFSGHGLSGDPRSLVGRLSLAAQ